MNLQDALNHPLFSGIPRPKTDIFKGKPISLDFEKENLNELELRDHFLKEI